MSLASLAVLLVVSCVQHSFCPTNPTLVVLLQPKIVVTPLNRVNPLPGVESLVMRPLVTWYGAFPLVLTDIQKL